jgi:hypothetical protein
MAWTWRVAQRPGPKPSEPFIGQAGIATTWTLAAQSLPAPLTAQTSRQ